MTLSSYKNIFLLSIFFIISNHFFSQVNQDRQLFIDSLMINISSQDNHDTIIMSSRARLGEVKLIFRSTFWDSISVDCQKIIDKSPKKNIRLSILKIQASAINNLGVISNHEGNQEKTLGYFFKD